jgi:hypothetical protein
MLKIQSGSWPTILQGDCIWRNIIVSVRIAMRFHPRFANKVFWVLILYHTLITNVVQHILRKIDPNFNSNHRLAGNRTQNCMMICMQNRTCRRPLTEEFLVW